MGSDFRPGRTSTGGSAEDYIYGGDDPIDGDKIEIDYSPTNYTPDTSPVQVSNSKELTSHLAGIDDALDEITGSLNVEPENVGDVLYSADGISFTSEVPLTCQYGWMVNNDGILLVLGDSTSPSYSYYPPSGAMVHYTFGNVAGSTVVDEMMVSNGTLVGGATTTADSERGYALVLGENNSYVSVPSVSTIKLTNQITFAMWAKTTTSEGAIGNATGSKELVTRRGSNIYFGLERDIEDSLVWLRMFINYPPPEEEADQETEKKDSEVSIRGGDWHHIAATFEQGNEFRLYIDGIEVDQEDQEAGYLNQPINTSSINNDYIIGAQVSNNDGTSERHFTGSIADFWIFNRALTQSEILSVLSSSL